MPKFKGLPAYETESAGRGRRHRVRRIDQVQPGAGRFRESGGPARTELPDVILLDLMLPDLDGLSVCEILNSNPLTRDIPILILSALDQSWAETHKRKARFARFFTKPVDLKVLRESVCTTAWEHLVQARSRLA